MILGLMTVLTPWLELVSRLVGTTQIDVSLSTCCVHSKVDTDGTAEEDVRTSKLLVKH